jgi:transcriptional regulator GlxA family with amidase domain
MSPKLLTCEEEQRVYAVKTHLLNHLHQSFTIQQLARMAALGEQKFSEGFCSLFGMPAGTYVHQSRMHTARFLLRHTDKPVQEVARLCGYSKARNFSSAFKQFFGRRPTEARE